MKNTLLTLTLLLALTVTVSANKPVNIGVIPTPQNVAFAGGFLKNDNHVKPHFHSVVSLDSVKTQEGAYIIRISRKKIDVFYSTHEGYLNSTRTLLCLCSHYRDFIPCMTITDWPAFRFRGWMDDISRGPVVSPTFSSYQKDLMSSLKMNFGSYYTEHTLYNTDYPDLTPDLTPLFAFEPNLLNVSSSDSMMANLQCLAHFEKTLRIPFYEYLMDSPYNVNPGKEETYDFLRSQIRNTWSKTPNARFFNIDCDETEAMGTGRARDYVARIGADSAYCRHIRRVYDIVMAEADSAGISNPEVLMWGDIVSKNPDMLNYLPHEMNYIVWSYGAQDSYESMIEPFSSRNLKFWVAPGVSHWSTLPLVGNYIKNIANLARDGYKAGARGLMITSWDDSGESLFSDTWHALAWAAEMAWHPIESSDPEELKDREKLFNEIFEETFHKVAPIYALGALADNSYVGEWFNTGALYQPLLNFYPSNTDSATLLRCDSVDRVVNEILAITDSAELPYVVYGCRRLLAVSMKSRLRVLLCRALNQHSDGAATANDPSQSTLEEAHALADAYFRTIYNLKREYLLLWDEESASYSRDIICERYDNLGREVQQAFNHVFIANNGGKLSLSTIDGSLKIYYTLDGRRPSEGSAVYTAPFPINNSCLVQTMTINKWGDKIYTSEYMLSHKGMGCLSALNTKYSDYRSTYSGGGDNALADGVLGSDDSYADGHWQGYCGDSIDVVYDFGKKIEVSDISFRALQKTFDWILAPTSMRVLTSDDGKNWKTVRTETFNPEFRTGQLIIHTDAAHNLNLTTRFLRVVIPNPGKLPEWHPGATYDSYIFVDEIVIE